MDDRDRTDPIEEGLFNTLLHGLFAFSPMAICVSTTDDEASRYVKVNDAYLQLVGRAREEPELYCPRPRTHLPALPIDGVVRRPHT